MKYCRLDSGDPVSHESFKSDKHGIEWICIDNCTINDCKRKNYAHATADELDSKIIIIQTK